jgi:hypothetical protein
MLPWREVTLVERETSRVYTHRIPLVDDTAASNTAWAVIAKKELLGSALGRFRMRPCPDCGRHPVVEYIPEITVVRCDSAVDGIMWVSRVDG